MTSESATLYNALERAIGEEPARLLMERIEQTDEVATKADVADLRRTTKKEIAELRTRMDAGFEMVDQRLAVIDQRFATIDQQFERIDERFEKIDQRFEKLDDRLFQFHETLRGYSRTFVTTQAASIVGAVGLAVAMIKFL
jgi:uncharacterized protein (DUF3084 family)